MINVGREARWAAKCKWPLGFLLGGWGVKSAGSSCLQWELGLVEEPRGLKSQPSGKES